MAASRHAERSSRCGRAPKAHMCEESGLLHAKLGRCSTIPAAVKAPGPGRAEGSLTQILPWACHDPRSQARKELGCRIIRVLAVVVKVFLGRGLLLGQARVRIVDALELDGGLPFVVGVFVGVPAGAAGETAEK